MWLPAPPRLLGTNGRLRKHGRELALSDRAACPDPQVMTRTVTSGTGWPGPPRGTGCTRG